MLFILLSIYVLLRISLDNNESIYDINDNKFTMIVDSFNIEGNKLSLTLKGKEDLVGSYYIDTYDELLYLKDNIKYGNPEATDAEVIDAAKAAHVHHFIKTLPKGYNSVLNEESSNVSAGQKQLLTIARVILADPKILILDEATSSIDTRTEKIVQDGMDKLMEGRTVFVIAHRLSTVRNSKAIMVLDHGRIIERGDHEDLIAQKGQYYQLYTGAFELE